MKLCSSPRYVACLRTTMWHLPVVVPKMKKRGWKCVCPVYSMWYIVMVSEGDRLTETSKEHGRRSPKRREREKVMS